ncbi:MAG: strawberry notch family protein, partial [Rhodoferax sp.]|nr:strawberry notch family protein [Rhodoferax sp.]
MKLRDAIRHAEIYGKPVPQSAYDELQALRKPNNTPTTTTSAPPGATQQPAQPVTGQGAGVSQPTQDVQWDSMTPDAKTDVLKRAGWRTNAGGLNVVGKNLLKKKWADIVEGTQATITKNIKPQQQGSTNGTQAKETITQKQGQPEAPEASVAQEPDDYLPKGWRKDGAFYEFRSASGSSFTPTQIAGVVGGTVTKQGMRSILGVPYHAWEAAKRKLKDAGMWDGQPPAQTSQAGVKPTKAENVKALADKLQGKKDAEPKITAKERERIRRDTEKSVYNDLKQSPDMVGKSVDEIKSALLARAPDSKPETISKMAAELHKEIQKNQTEIEKQKHRDPSILDDAMSTSMPNGMAPESFPQFQIGFSHALAGKTKSTLAGDGLDSMVKGYEAAQKWIKTPVGRAFYDGVPVNKLQNTGFDLRRHWELMKASMKAAETDVQKAWAAIERATNRADFFAPIMVDGIKPGFRLYVTTVRDSVMPFKKWLNDKTNWYGRRKSKYSTSKKSDIDYMLDGERYPGELSESDRQKYQTDNAYRIDYLKNKAEQYLKAVEEHIGFLQSKTSVKDAAEAFSAAFMAENKPNGSYFQTLNRTPLGDRVYGAIFDGTYREFQNLRDTSDWTIALIEKEDTIELPNRATPLTPPKLDRVIRSDLADHRSGKDVTPDQFKKQFGFADVGFGEWVGAKQDQDHLNYAFDAFMDLAKHFGISPKNVGMGIHFTIGALGHGKHSAHFSPAHPGPEGSVQVINLTNTKGDGAVYHEWTHALDHNMGGQWKKSGYGKPSVRNSVLMALKQQAMTVESLEARAKSFLFNGTYWKSDKRMDKVKAAIWGIERFTTGETAYKQNADALGKDYWGNDQELIARASEAWAADTLGGDHSYLVNANWVGDGKVTAAKGYRGTPYPTGDERKRFNQVFSALAKATKFDDNGNPTVSIADFESALNKIDGGEAAKVNAYREKLKTTEGMTELRDRVIAAKEAEQQAKVDEQERLAAEKLAELESQLEPVSPPVIDPPKPDVAQGPLTDDDLSALFDQAAAELRESQQENPQEPAPAEQQENPGPAFDKWTIAELQELMEKAHDADLIVLSGGGGIPNVLDIHELGNLGHTEHIGFGMFETKGVDDNGKPWTINWSGGGEMSRLSSGKPYTNVSLQGPGVAPFPSGIKRAIQAEIDRLASLNRKPYNLKDGIALNQEKKAEQQKKADPKASALIAEAAKLGVTGISEALTGLSKLFGSAPGRLNSFPAGFDEETYAKAKPHFQASLEAFQKAGKTLKDLFMFLIQNFGEGVKMYAIQFAKDQSLTNSLGEDAKTSPSSKVADWVQGKLAAGTEFKWQELFDVSDTAWGGTQAQGKYTSKDAYDAMEMGMNRYILANPTAFNPNANGEVMSTVARLQRLTQLLVTQTKRTAEMDEFQQFSTVPAFAFVANWVAGVRSTDVMMEPSAGIGGLAVFAKNSGAQLVLNELSSRRAAVLQEVFPSARVFHENAEQLNNILPADIKPTVVVMNPPFSASAGRLQGERNTQLGAKHVEQALERLDDGGRLVAIVGEGMSADRPAFKAWWKKISTQYDVRAIIPVDGKGYAKYGTTFSNALLVIDKVKPSGRTPITMPAATYEDLIGILSEVRNDRPATVQHQDTSAQRDGAESARQDTDAPKGDSTQPQQPDSLGTPELDGRKPLSKPNSGGNGGGGGRRSSTRKPASDIQQPGGRPAADAGANAGASSSSDGGNNGLDVSGVTLTSEKTASGELTDSVFESYQPQRLQIPGSQPHPGALVQSAAMASVLPPAATYVPNLPVETITEGKLSLAQLEAVVYAGQAHQEFLEEKPHPKVVDKFKINADQQYRKGFFIGDGTGLGKGREIGGIILDNLRQGRKKAIWISEKQGLMNDAKRDFTGVGGDEKLIFNLSDGAKDRTEGVMFTTYSTLRVGADDQAAANKKGGKKAGDRLTSAFAIVEALKVGDTVKVSYGFAGQDSVRQYDARITYKYPKVGNRVQVFDYEITTPGPYKGHTLDDVSPDFESSAELHGLPKIVEKPKKDKADSIARIQEIINWVGPDYDGVIAFDESHNGGNAVSIKGDRGTSEPSKQAMAMLELQARLPKARVVYVSATGATTVDNLAYASRLGLWGAGTPFPNVRSFVSEMQAGGLATMELVARDMKQMGVYMARSLSFDGVTYGRIDHELTDLQADAYNVMARAWQITLKNINAALEATGAVEPPHHEGGRPVTKNSDAKKNAMTAYWGAQLRFFNQIITSMQMPSVIEQMERDIAAGNALVLQLVNTNEAAQNRAMNERVDGDADASLEDLDLTPKAALLSMIDRSFPTTQMQDETDENGNTIAVPVKDSEGKLVQNANAVALKKQLMSDIENIHVFPDGPLEIVLNHFGVETVAEVTGRGQRIVRKKDKDGVVRAQLEKRGSGANKADAESFMADKKNILIFSDAGGTGYSFHADKTKINQRKRSHYLIQPGWRADKAVQGFGRSHRTNQKSAPHYWLAATNVPAHKRFLSAIARRLDMLGAMTKGQRDTANQGMFSEKDNLDSKYAQQAVAQLFRDAMIGQVAGIP